MAVLSFIGGGPAGSKLVDGEAVIQFEVNGTLTSAAGATPVILIPDSMIPSGMAVYIMRWFLTVNGGTAWTDATGTVVILQDTAAAAAVTWAKAGLTGNALLVPGSASTTLAALMLSQVGLTANKGLQIVADHTFTAGSDIKIDVAGYIK